MTLIKKILFVSLILILTFNSKAQTSYFGNVSTNADKLEAFKKTTTLFTLPYADYQNIDQFEEAIKKSWTITPYKIIKPEELVKYQALADYSFFYLDTYNDQIDTIINQNLVYGLKMILPSTKPKQMEETTLAMITLFADGVSNLQVTWVTEQGGSKRSVKSKQLSILYNHSKFLNWSAGLLSGYLKQINDGLLMKQTRALDYQFYNKKRLPELVEETLFIPEYVREIFSSQRVTLEPAPVDERYRYKFKFVTHAVLDSLILNQDSNIKYLVYTKRSNDKIISIYDSKDGLLIYQMFSFQSPDFGMSDLNKIRKTIQLIK